MATKQEQAPILTPELNHPQTPQVPSLIHENIMQQQTSVASKSKEAMDIKSAAESINISINKLSDKLEGLFKPAAVIPPTPNGVVPPLVPENPPVIKKSLFKSLEEEIDKTFGF